MSHRQEREHAGYWALGFGLVVVVTVAAIALRVTYEVLVGLGRIGTRFCK